MKDPRKKSSYTLEELYNYAQSINDESEARAFLDSLCLIEKALLVDLIKESI